MSYYTIILENGEEIYVESSSIVPTGEGPVQASLSEVFEKKSSELIHEISKIGSLLKDVHKSIMNDANSDVPDHLELEVGVGIDQSLGCVVLNSTVNAQITIKFSWEKNNERS